MVPALLYCTILFFRCDYHKHNPGGCGGYEKGVYWCGSSMIKEEENEEESEEENKEEKDQI